LCFARSSNNFVLCVCVYWTCEQNSSDNLECRITRNSLQNSISFFNWGLTFNNWLKLNYSCDIFCVYASNCKISTIISLYFACVTWWNRRTTQVPVRCVLCVHIIIVCVLCIMWLCLYFHVIVHCVYLMEHRKVERLNRFYWLLVIHCKF